MTLTFWRIAVFILLYLLKVNTWKYFIPKMYNAGRNVTSLQYYNKHSITVSYRR